MKRTDSQLHMAEKRHALEHAREERRLRKLAWRLGVSTKLLKAAMDKNNQST